MAVVTGAANGIGRAVALRLRDDGFRVAAADIEPVEPADGVDRYRLDVADLDAHEPLVSRIEHELGPLTALVNVAGICLPEPIEKLTLDAYRRQHAGAHGRPGLAGPRRPACGWPRAAPAASSTSPRCTPAVGEAGTLAYDSAKAGLEAATRTLAIELGPRGVLVNSVAPGFVRTRMSVVNGVNELDSAWFRDIYHGHGKLPLRRAAEPDEIASAVSYLVSAGNTYVTGQRMVVDGGLTVTF